MGKKAKPAGSRWLTAVVADATGAIFDLDGFAAAGMTGPVLTPLNVKDTRALPHGTELMYLPQRVPVLLNLRTRKFEALWENPFEPGTPIYPVAAFNSPGYVTTHVPAYQEREDAGFLPLFSYGAVGWQDGGFRSTVIRVDWERRQDLRLMAPEKVAAGVQKMARLLPGNRLRQHLEHCALTYGCPAGKNFFLGRFEAPLPTSRHCNARCLGCISLQPNPDICASQNRISFTPTPEEIAEVALAHIQRVKHAVVSFGQGCEGDPLMAAEVIEPAIRRIRKHTDKGTINLNSNASMPDAVDRLFSAGLDSIRVSLNSARKACYEAYFRPTNYRFEAVLESIDVALGHNGFVSLNYLNSPGFTDTPQEAEALAEMIDAHPVHLIQWRNLNFDPLRYWQAMGKAAPMGTPMGMRLWLETLHRQFPKLKYGYFNPPRETFNKPSTR
jgi:pyruvate-formate lyase-activating enzyme